MRKTILMGVAIVFLFALVSVVSAQAVAPFSISNVKIDNEDLTGVVYDVERTDQVTVEVLVKANDTITTDNVRVKAEILGYEYGDIEDETDLFEMEAGKTYKKKLVLAIPDDIDASEVYTLRIKVSSSNDQIESTYTLHIDEPRHFVKPFAVLVQPSNGVKAGASICNCKGREPRFKERR